MSLPLPEHPANMKARAVRRVKTVIKNISLNSFRLCRCISQIVFTISLLSSLLSASSCTESKDHCLDLKELLSLDPQLAAERSIASGDQRLIATGGFAPHVPGVDDGYRPLRVIPGTGDDQRVECRQLQVKIIRYSAEYNKKIADFRKNRSMFGAKRR